MQQDVSATQWSVQDVPGEARNSSCLKRAAEVLSAGFTHKIFPPHLQLIPQMHELYEMELACAEASLLTDYELVQNAGYFAKVGDAWTRHFLICSGEPLRLPKHSSSKLRAFFESNQFRTGYATHGLFPYRGKFHPQMVKGLLNAMGLRRGDTVLDPMMGSGTVLIEAKLMGIKSVGIDASPFCRFMTQTKLYGLTIPLGTVKSACDHCSSVFEHFKKRAGQPVAGSKLRSNPVSESLGVGFKEGKCGSSASGSSPLPDRSVEPEVYDFLLLAYLDSAGYAERSERRSPFEQFRAILERYAFVAEKIQNVLQGFESELAEATALEGDARQLPIDDKSIDGILFSPPYSFAIDYLENDSFHLNFMGVDREQLRSGMVGLRGRTLREKFDLYQTDMGKVIAECARVLRVGGFCTIVVGTNSNQLGKALGVAADEVTGIDEVLVELARPFHLNFVRRLSRQIRGMANTMRTEVILFLQKA